MATTAHARAATARPRPLDEPERGPARPAARRVPRARARVASRAGLGRALILFVACLSLLAVGRVALSFAVVQKTLQTDAVASQQRALSAENAQLAEEVAQLTSAVRIRSVAQRELGLVNVDQTLVRYLEAPRLKAAARGGAGR